MHARDLVEVAGLVALNGPLLVCGRRSPNATHLEEYWATSRTRFENWSRVLKAYSALNLQDSRQDLDRWIEVRAALDEIFTSEILTRVLSAVFVACDRSAGASLAEPIARSILTSHLEARHRAMGMLVHGRGVSTPQAVALNRLRRRAERWSDVLVGGLLHLSDVREFAVEPERAEDFAADLADRRSHPGGLHAWRLTLVSLHNAFRTGLSPLAANPDANARITSAILGCFPADLFDSTGLFQSLWMFRLAANTSNVQGMISDLLRPGPRPRADQSAIRRKRRI
jgi:hypothetical protein